MSTIATTRHTIPAGYNFGPDLQLEGVGAFFAWLADNMINPAQIDPAADVVITADKNTKGVTWSLTATTTSGHTGTWPLAKLPTITITDWLDQFAPKPVDVSEMAQAGAGQAEGCRVAVRQTRRRKPKNCARRSWLT